MNSSCSFTDSLFTCNPDVSIYSFIYLISLETYLRAPASHSIGYTIPHWIIATETWTGCPTPGFRDYWNCGFSPRRFQNHSCSRTLRFPVPDLCSYCFSIFSELLQIGYLWFPREISLLCHWIAIFFHITCFFCLVKFMMMMMLLISIFIIFTFLLPFHYIFDVGQLFVSCSLVTVAPLCCYDSLHCELHVHIVCSNICIHTYLNSSKQAITNHKMWYRIFGHPKLSRILSQIILETRLRWLGHIRGPPNFFFLANGSYVGKDHVGVNKWLGIIRWKNHQNR